jgi:hypothetical protein
MKKLFIVALMVLSLAIGAGNGFACDGPDCSASGNFDISTFAVGGGIDLDGALIPNGGAFGISGAGGISGGVAEGAFESFTFGRRHPITITLGGASGDLHSVGGGLTNTESYTYHPSIGDVSIGVVSTSDNYAVTSGSLHVDAWGLAHSEGFIGGLAGQGSLNGSVIGGSPMFGWESDGGSFGLAGQGSVGGFVGGAGTVFLGSADVEASVEMWGGSGSESYRAISWDGNSKTEIMGSNVSANTNVTSYGNVDTCLVGYGAVEGGYIATGGAVTGTYQTTNGGVAGAFASGSYIGAGELGCNFNGSAVGYTQTSATTLNGYNGSVMSSSAGMQVSSNGGNGQLK